MRHIHLLALVVSFLLVSLTAGAASSQDAVADDLGEFVAFCPFSHRAGDDPIVHPGMSGMSHTHDFLGNRDTNADSTYQTLLLGETTCDPLTDLSAYWVPTLYDAQGEPIAIEQATIYYLASAADVQNPAALQPYPLGLKIVAGNAKATSPAEAAHFKWSCLGAPDSSTTDFVNCPQGSRLELLLNFPDCWNGVDLDSPDHKSHMAYRVADACPASHPVAVPRLQFKLRYATEGEPGLTLASGSAYTTHGDFFNAWEPAALENRMECLRNLVKCGPEGYAEPAAPAHSLHIPLVRK